MAVSPPRIKILVFNPLVSLIFLSSSLLLTPSRHTFQLVSDERLRLAFSIGSADFSHELLRRGNLARSNSRRTCQVKQVSNPPR